MNIRIKDLIIIFLFFSIYPSTILEETMHFYGIRLISLSIAAFFSIFFFLNKKSYKLYNYQIFLLFTCLILMIVSAFLVWSNFFSINLFLAVITALIIYVTDKYFFLKLLYMTLFLQVSLQTYEFLTNSYIYEYSIKFGSIEADLTLHNMGVFRGKGLFEGPLTASSFAIYLAYFFRHNPLVLFLALYSALLTNSRLGILVLLIMNIIFIVNYVKNKKLSKSMQFFIKFFFPFLFIFGGYILYNYVIPMMFEPKAVERIYDTFNTGTNSNSMRIYFWLSGIKEYWNYSILHKLFGNSLYFGQKYNGSAESDWIMLFLETGVFGFLMYFLPVAFIFIKSIKMRKWNLFLIVSLWVLIIFEYRHISSAYTNVLHWLLVFMFIDELNNKPWKIPTIFKKKVKKPIK